MERTVRYEVLENEEEEVAAQPVAMAMIVPPAPPPYESETAATGGHCDPQPAKLPNYVEATTLPTYEEAERSKLEEEEAHHAGNSGEDSALVMESGEGGVRPVSDVTIGTDCTFICTFLVSFLFNWLGFLISVCLSSSVAGHCGAMSGLGLSIIKWVAIVKQGQWADHVVNGDSWLWWLMFFCGFLLFIRGAVQYVRVKYEWTQLNSRVRHYRLF